MNNVHNSACINTNNVHNEFVGSNDAAQKLRSNIMTVITAKKFKEARKYLRLNQTQMGERLGGYTLRAVQYWENGEREIPLGVQLIITQLTMQEEMLDALVKMTTSFAPDENDQSDAYENAIQTIEKYSGMSYLEYLKTKD